jgi:DNA invertase Pin-like site-specific DNA recombinase
MKAVVYLMASNDAELMRGQHAAISYAQNRGWPKPPSEAWGSVATKPGEYLPETLGTLSAGDVLLIPSVNVLAERPSQIERIVRECIGRGVRIHCLDLGGDINQHVQGLFAAWGSAAAVEAELDRTVADLKDAEERHAQDLRDFEGSLLDRIRAEGLTIQVGKAAANGNGHVDESLGDQIKSARAKRNLSQRQLGDLAGVSHTQVGRIETFGRGEGLEAVMAALGLQDTSGLLNTPATEREAM